jgi:hypothetical protein
VCFSVCSGYHGPERRHGNDRRSAPPADEGAGLRAAERHAANAILDRPNGDPDDDAAIVARAALRLAADEGAGRLDEVREIEAVASQVHDSIWAEPFDETQRKLASDGIWRIHQIIRPRLADDSGGDT